MHRQGSFERVNWHSVGHLRTSNEIHGENNRGDDIDLPCMVPEARGKSEARYLLLVMVCQRSATPGCQ